MKKRVIVWCLILILISTFCMAPIKAETNINTKEEIIKVGIYDLDGYHSIDKEGKVYGALMTLKSSKMMYEDFEALSDMTVGIENGLTYIENVVAIALLIIIVVIILVLRQRAKYVKHLKLKNAQLGDAIEQAQQASKAKTNFLARMSHEIRTPMNAILGVSTLTRKNLDDKKKIIENLDKIEYSSKMLINIINDVLDMSAIEENKVTLQNVSFDFKQMLTSITDTYYTLCKEKNIEFKVILSGITEEILVGDPLRLNQILNNLLSNALKFTKSEGEISIIISQQKIEKDKAYMSFTVCDNGCGISEEMKERLFRPFEQENSKVAIEHGGSGLGLSITKNFVDMMQGSIDFKSEKGVGTTFIVSIPFTRSEERINTTTDKLSRISSLIIDDESDSRDYIAMILNRLGVSHDEANSGKQAIEMFEKAYKQGKGYDVCFVDWKMPDMDGSEVAKQIRKQFDEDTLIIIVSAYDTSEIEDDGKDNGVNMFLTKPIFQSTVYNLLMTLCGSDIAEEMEDAGDYDFSNIKIMAVDDTAFNLEIIRDILELTGAQVECAENGKEAYDKFMASEEGEYDVILMDVQMPVMDGHEATKVIRNSNHPDAKNIQIIALTANAFTEDITESFTAGMNDYLTKPVNTDVLYKTINRIIEDKIPGR